MVMRYRGCLESVRKMSERCLEGVLEFLGSFLKISQLCCNYSVIILYITKNIEKKTKYIAEREFFGIVL